MLRSVRILASQNLYESKNQKSQMISNDVNNPDLISIKLHPNPKIFRINSKGNLGKQTHGYIPKIHTTTAKKVTPASQSLLENFILEAVPKKTLPIKMKGSQSMANIHQSQYQQQQQQLQQEEHLKQQPVIYKEESTSEEGSLAEFNNNFDQDLLDNQVVEQIERYKRKGERHQSKLNKMKRDYDKADVKSRVSNYDRKAIYEELKLKEIEIRQQLQEQKQNANYGVIRMTPQNDVRHERSHSSERKRDKIQRNILFSREGLTTASSSQGYRVPRIPYSSTAQFNNMSEKERFLKISHEFNKLKSHIEAHKYEDYDYCLQYLVTKIGSKIQLTRDMVKVFLNFVKDEHRQFDLTTNIDEIILSVIQVQDAANEIIHETPSPSPMKRSQTADVGANFCHLRQTRDDYQKRLLDVIQEYQNDLGGNYKLWNEKYEYNYDAIPRKLPMTGLTAPKKRGNKRKNKLHYQRKVPHAIAAQKIHNVLSTYIDENKVLGAKEVLPPSLHKEFSCAINFNKETVNTVLNYAQESRVKLMNSLSTNDLQKNVGSSEKETIKGGLQRSAHNASTQNMSVMNQKGQNLSQIENGAYAKISKMHNTESESVYKRNNLMLEHVMLERAVKRLQSRKDKREEKKVQETKPSNDWKLRQSMANDVFEQRKHRVHTAQVLTKANSIKQL